MNFAYVFAAVFTIQSVTAYVPAINSRRDALQNIAVGFALVTASPVSPSYAFDACPPKANNCVSTTWTPPKGSKADVVKSLKEVINAYPLEGQNDVDGGGWKIAQDNLSGDGSARVEYMSSGKGNFAKFFNGGKPFVDDLNIFVEENGVVQVRSQSRVGDSDFGVNAKVRYFDLLFLFLFSTICF